jgi:hypothetical protein
MSFFDDAKDFVEDIGESIGDVGASIDDAVNDNIPGGWVTVGAVALGGAAAAGAFGAGAGAAAGLTEAELLAADAAIAEGTAAGAGATVAGADAVLPGALASEGTAQLGTGTALAEGATTNPLSPYYGVGADASNPLLTSAGYGSTELGGTGSIIGSGTGLGVSTLPEVSAATGFGGLTAADFPSYDVSNAGNGVNAKDVADALRKANTVRKLLTPQNSQMMQSFNALNNPSGNMSGTGLPTEYRAKNPFSFGEQQQPIQNTLATLLRNNNGNS